MNIAVLSVLHVLQAVLSLVLSVLSVLHVLRAVVTPASMRLCASLGEMLAIVGISVQSRSLSMDCTSGAGHTGSSLGSGL